MHIRYKLITVLLFFLQYLSAQQYNFINYSIAEGLPRSGTYWLMEDSKGFMWVGTEGGGAAVFDGKNFQKYTTEDGLGHNIVRVLFEDSKGNIWFGLKENGVSVFNGETFKTYSIKDGLAGNQVRTIAQDDNDRIWLGTFGGISVLEFSENDSLSITNYTADNELPHKKVRAIIKDSKGTIWIGTDGGLVKYNGKDFTTYGYKQGLYDKRILSLVRHFFLLIDFQVGLFLH